MIIEKGDKIKVDYEGKFETGEVFDSSKHGDHSHPLEFEVGSGQVIKGFDNGVLGLKEGEEKEISIKSADAYGEMRDDLKKEFPKAMVPEGQDIKEGMVLGMQTPDGHQIPARIVEVKESAFVVDLNHPLAGKNLIFKIKIVSIEKGSKVA